MENKITVFITEADFLTANQRLEKATQLLKPFLQTLTSDQRIKLLKMNDRGISLIQEAILNSTNSHSSMFNDFDLADLEKDPVARQQLIELYKICEQLCSKINDSFEWHNNTLQTHQKKT